MGYKSVLFLGLLLAVFLISSSAVRARELVETSPSKETTKQTNGVDDAKADGGYGGYNGGGYGGGHRGGGGGYGGGHHGDGGGYGGGHHGGGGYEGGHHGGGGYYGGGGHHGGGGGYCRYGCCSRNYYGNGCRRCCSYAGEAMEQETQH